MIKFRHKQQSIELSPSEFWSESSLEPTYRDAPQQELLELVEEIGKGSPWREAVNQRYQKENPWLNSIVTSPQRDLFFRKYPIRPSSRVLDIGSGWGQIALPLAREHEVVCLEPTEERIRFIEAASRQEGLDKDMYFIESDFFSIDFETKFDVACCIGVLEWTPKFRQGEAIKIQTEFLARCRGLLKQEGQLIIGIENRMGLKYLMGAPDDHNGHAHVGVYDYQLANKKWQQKTGEALRAVTHTRSELESMLTCAGFSSARFFSAFPDYKLPEAIYPLGTETEKHCATGQFITEHDGINGKPLQFQSELQSHYKSLAQMKIASNFAPSFFIIAE